MTTAPIALTIALDNTTHSTLPASLEQRLSGSPTKTPADLANELRAHAEKTAKLRNAHLDAVRDRASRESQRAAEAASRKLRLAASRVDKVQRRLSAAETKSTAKREASEAEREARKARRAEMALAVSEARKAAVEARELRQSQLLSAEKHAFTKHTKIIAEVADKSRHAVQHAMAVVEAQKEKEAKERAAAGEKLAEKLEKAAETRAFASPVKACSSPSRHATVLNESKVAAETKRVQYAASLAKHAAKREALILQTAQKAAAENARAASVVQALKAKDAGADQATVEAKAALYDKLLRAEVSRLSQLKSKCLLAHKGRGDTVSAIVVRVDNLKLRTPPPALSLRLSVVPTTLLATAAARQAGAAARRAATAHAAALKAAKANEKRAAALGRAGKALAQTEAKVAAKAARALIASALVEGKRLHAVASCAKKQLAAGNRREEAAKAQLAKGAAAQAKADAAAEKRAAKVRATAKAGVCAVKLAAFTARRELLAGVATAKGEVESARCTRAAAKRAGALAERVALAQKRMKLKTSEA